MQIPSRVGFPIRKSADQRSLASPRSLSQRATSFIASWRQGIHRTLLSRSIHTTNARTQDQTPQCKSSAYQTNRLSFTHSLLFTTPTHPHSSRHTCIVSPVTNQSDSLIKQQCHLDQPPQGHHQATNLSCSGTPSSKEEHSAPQPTRLNSLETVGIEPTAPCLQSRCSTTELRPQKTRTSQPFDMAERPLIFPECHPQSWWAKEDLNLRPHAYQACALTN